MKKSFELFDPPCLAFVRFLECKQLSLQLLDIFGDSDETRDDGLYLVSIEIRWIDGILWQEVGGNLVWAGGGVVDGSWESVLDGLEAFCLVHRC